MALVKHNQSVLDIAVQHFGTLESLLALAYANNLSPTDELVSGGQLELPEYSNGQDAVVGFYQKNQVKPATALTDVDFTIVEIESCNLCNCFK